MLEESDFETTIKIIVVGNGCVGKTTMIHRFCTGEYTADYKKTLGVDFLEKDQYIPALGTNAKLMLWDTAGQEEFDTITRAYYRGAGGCVLVFSTIDRDSFRDIEKWKRKVEDECGPLPMALVQNKMDLLDKAVVTSDEAEALAKRLGVKFFRTCVLEGMNVDKVFEYLAEKFVIDIRKTKEAAAAAPTIVGSLPKQDASQPKADNNPSFQLTDAKPKQRTGGKKSMKCSIL